MAEDELMAFLDDGGDGSGENGAVPGVHVPPQLGSGGSGRGRGRDRAGGPLTKRSHAACARGRGRGLRRRVTEDSGDAAEDDAEPAEQSALALVPQAKKKPVKFVFICCAICEQKTDDFANGSDMCRDCTTDVSCMEKQKMPPETKAVLRQMKLFHKDEWRATVKAWRKSVGPGQGQGHARAHAAHGPMVRCACAI